jgi:hypothetical protein
MIRYAQPAGVKHRRTGPAVEHGWTWWPRHRDDTNGPAASNGFEEMQLKWVAAMKVREMEKRRREMAVWS